MIILYDLFFVICDTPYDCQRERGVKHVIEFPFMNQLPFIQMIQLYVCVNESHEVKALITMLHSWTTQDERWDSLKCENIEQMAEPAIYGWSFLCHVSVVALWKTLIMESCVSITNTSPVLLSIFSLSYLLLQCLIVSDCRLCVCVC